jgi:hypothetical protein
MSKVKIYNFEKWNPSAGKNEMAPRLRDPQIYRNGRRRNRVKSASAGGCRKHMLGATSVSYAVFEPFSKGLVGRSS